MTLASDNLARDRETSVNDHGRLHDDRSLQHDVYAVIVEWLHRGALRPGDRISEAAIARQLGISRGPVREAMSRLDNEGLVIRRPRRGPVVAALTPKDLDDIATVRQLVEGYAARCACQLLTPDDVQELEQLIAAMHAAALAGHWTETASLNARFHQTVVRIAGNRVLTKMWQSLHPLAWLLAPTVSPNKEHDLESLLSRHHQLLTVLQEGDPDRAEAAFRLHVEQSARRAQHLASGSPVSAAAVDAGPRHAGGRGPASPGQGIEPVPRPLRGRPQRGPGGGWPLPIGTSGSESDERADSRAGAGSQMIAERKEHQPCARVDG